LIETELFTCSADLGQRKRKWQLSKSQHYKGVLGVVPPEDFTAARLLVLSRSAIEKYDVFTSKIIFHGMLFFI